MCGIAGTWWRGQAIETLVQTVTGMAEAVRHRGPDDQGIWIDERGALALAHRRLSIIDVSVAGHQPMQSADGRFMIVFNGEVYNHLEIRAKLPNKAWRGHSDTETLLAGDRGPGASKIHCDTLTNRHVRLRTVGS
jgi:asparagine synthase (glutamine-hydrolysing)